MTALEIRPLGGAGAEILGVDISELTVGDWNQIEAAFAAFGAVVFRDQILNEQAHIDFARRWGPIVASNEDTAHERFSSIDVGGPASAPPSPQTWRSERSYEQTPRLGAVVVARALPHGDPYTLLCSTADAFDALSSSTQRELEGLTAIHSRGGPEEPALHPVVIRHPVSGRKTLFVNPTFTTGIEGMNEIDGLALLNQLYEHCQSDEFIGRIDWERGSVALWDERAMWSFAGGPQMGKDVFHRVAISGTALVPGARTDRRTPTRTERAGATLAGGVVAAAMMGIAEVIDPERVRPEIEIVSEAPEQEPLTPLDFGSLPPLD